MAAFLLAFGLRVHWLPHQAGAIPEEHPAPGEMFAGLITAERYRADGFRYWLLERIPDSTGRPKLYTHNVNLNGLLQFALRALGATDHVPLAIINATAFMAGLWLAFLVVLRASRDAWLALLFLLFFSTNYYFNLLFAFNLRAWHWLGLFGVLYCVLLLSGTPEERKLGLRWMFPACLVAFACAYDFAAEVAAAGLATAALTRNLRAASAVVVGFGAAFCLRQVQVIGAVGPTAWALDLWYTALIKTGFLAKLVGVPNIAEIDAWYDAVGILRYPSNPGTTGPLEHLRIALGYFWKYWIPYLGATSVGLLGILAAGRPGWRFLLAMSIGIWIGMLFFAPYSIHWAMGMKVPLLLAPIALATGVLAGALLPRGRIGVALVIGLALLHVGTQIRNGMEFPLSDRPYAPLQSLYGR